MDKIIKARAAPYPDSNIFETDAIITFCNIVDENVKTHGIERMDKIPNHDGYLEITDVDQTPIGMIFVQIKKLADKNIDNPKYPCKTQLLSHCEDSISPVLIIVVDTKNELAYWRLIDYSFLKDLEINPTAKTKTIKFPIKTAIKKGNSDYLDEWKEIIKRRKMKIDAHDSLLIDNENLKHANALLSSKSNPFLGLENAEFENVHRFLDTLNMQLDTDFTILKNIFYNSCWKLGIAYNNYTKDNITYMLYPIDIHKNDLQIKQMSKELMRELTHIGLSLSAHYQGNPIDNRPEDYAIEFIRNRIKELFNSKLLPINNISLFREMMFSFINQFHDCLGLEKKDCYTIKEMRFSLNIYFPIWIIEVLRNKEIRLGNQSFIDPDLILCQLNKMEINEFNANVKKIIKSNQFNSENLVIGDHQYPLKLIMQMLNSPAIDDLVEIKRYYISPNYDRCTNKYIWSPYSSEDIKENIIRFYNKIPEIYDNIIDSFFPALKQQLAFFAKFDRLVIILDVEDFCESSNIPIMDIYYLKCNGVEEINENRIDVYIKNDNCIPINFGENISSEIMLHGQQYTITRKKSQNLYFIVNRLPMYTHLYELLDENFAKFFRNDYQNQLHHLTLPPHPT